LSAAVLIGARSGRRRNAGGRAGNWPARFDRLTDLE
jgi:hypothetical protein